jgi:hypothetical protein
VDARTNNGDFFHNHVLLDSAQDMNDSNDNYKLSFHNFFCIKCLNSVGIKVIARIMIINQEQIEQNIGIYKSVTI